MPKPIKYIFNLLGPLLVVGGIFFGSQIWMNNYDIRYLKPHRANAVIDAVELRPEGMYKVSRVVGRKVRFHETYMPKHSLLKISFDDHTAESTILYQQNFKAGQKIEVCYYKPKYFGDPFDVKPAKGKCHDL